MGAIGQSAASSSTTLLSAVTITNNSYSASSAWDVTGGGSAPFDVLADFELAFTQGTAPTADTAFVLFLVPSLDGTNYGDGDASIVPGWQNYVGYFPVRAVTSAQRQMFLGVPVRPGSYKAVLKNDGTGQSATSVTLKVWTRKAYAA